MSFELILASNSSLDLYPKNSTGHFINKLPIRLYFPPQNSWFVTLREISYPRSLYNVRNAKYRIKYLDDGQLISD